MKYHNTIAYIPKTYANKSDWPIYTIVGRCTCGSRHYSEPMSYENALAIMPKYMGVVDYFGGGTVDLIDWDGNILKTKHIH